MYNVLEKLRAGAPLSERERQTHEQGLVSVLCQLHDELDAAVAASYGFPPDLSEEEILSRLVALNAARSAEEQRGLIRWLRPEFQHPTGATQIALDTGAPVAAAQAPARRAEKLLWPKALADQARAVRQSLAAQPAAVTADQLARLFQRANRDRIAELLDTLVSLGQAAKSKRGAIVTRRA